MKSLQLALPVCLLISLNSAHAQPPQADAPTKSPSIDHALATKQLVAWCIVPFDAKKRTPAERATMLKELGMTRCAYDWRAEHVPTFEAEILEYKKHGIEFFAFWGEHAEAFDLFAKHDIHPQIWRMMPNPGTGSDAEKAQTAAAQLKPLAEKAKSLGCKLGIYNHGGWNGQPQNMVAVCKILRAMGHDHVGIVYNFHHGHEHIKDWPRRWTMMLPYIHCLNINGMNPAAQPKILGLGKGQHELEMLQVVQRSGYNGPIGILDHRSELDAKKSLEENLNGLRWLRAELKSPGSGGLKPTPSNGLGAVIPEAFQQSFVAQGKESYRSPPLTISCRAALASKANYNILLASETKQSPSHWELFTVRGSGKLALYMPGCRPDHVHTNINICDGRSRLLKCVYEPTRVRIWIDNKLAVDQLVKRVRDGDSKGGIAVGRLVEGGLGCSGHIDWARVQFDADLNPIKSGPPHEVSSDAESTWVFKPRNPASAVDATPAESGVYDPQRVQALVAASAAHGNAVRGAKVFATAKFACISCHQVLGQGGLVGPNLVQSLAKRKPNEIVESILWPRRSVAKEYVVWQLVTSDGERKQGYLVPSDDGEVALRDPATGSISRWAKDDVERLVEATTLMPDGLANAMTEQQLLDVVRFVQTLPHIQQGNSGELVAALKQAQHHHPASFEYTRAPLDPAAWPSARHPVNRDRIYDFYAKQAE